MTEASFYQAKLYKTGDLAYWNSDGTVQYVGREDNQVKLRGFRIELDEIKSRIVAHDWVNNAAVILKDNPNTGHQNLIAFIELDPKEATLMDQGNHDSHHQSKESKAQVMMQISNAGCREKSDLFEKDLIDLPGFIPTKKQTDLVFYRKSYRFYEGKDVISKDDVLRLLESKVSPHRSKKIDDMSYIEFGTILRYFGQFISNKRLLPKYGYASPGALYATQMYFELNGVGELIPGYYYYHPVTHQLIRIKNKVNSEKTEIKIHFIGKKNAIEPIYKNNIQEVLEIEAGHMVGLFEKILPEYGLSIEDCEYVDLTKKYLDVAAEDLYLGTFQMVSGRDKKMDEDVEIYFQSHSERVIGLKTGQYQLKDKTLEKISDEVILRKQVIAINQEVYNRSSFGITVVSKTTKDWMGYINLGRKLQQLQMNDINLGFMASGYSSKTGCDLPSAKRINAILGKQTGPSYFFIGGRISQEQKRSRGMNEDTLHMKGPAEMIRDDLKNFLPEHMLPNKIIVLDKMPLTVNGKIDFNALQKKKVDLIQQEYIAPRTEIEQKIHDLWKNEIKSEVISIHDNFFELGGNSLIAVNLITKMNKELRSSLSLQVLFESPTIEKLAVMIGHENEKTISRLIPLQTKGSKKPIYCWPGLGGYCMNLRLLAEKTGLAQPFYGLQAYGLNKNEIPYPSIQTMAAADVKLIKQAQPVGPYTLWGYSFGARIAFEAAYQLEQSGAVVENLFLIAPGSPEITENKASVMVSTSPLSSYSNKIYLTILFSVFMGNITDSGLAECLKTVNDEEGFITYIMNRNSLLGRELVKKIINIVSRTYDFNYSFKDLMERQLNAPITVFKAKGDALSFIEVGHGSSTKSYTVLNLKANHYSMLKDPDIGELIHLIKSKQANRLDPKGSLPLTRSMIRNDQLYERMAENQLAV